MIKQVAGTIITDPVAHLAAGSKITFTSQLFPIGSPAGEYTVDNWGHFEGICLAVSLSDGKDTFVHGSAVLVAPGVALMARHVLQEILPLVSGHVSSHTLTCLGMTDSQLMLWVCTKITAVQDNSDLLILILSYVSDWPPDKQFRIATLTTRLPKVGEPVTMIGFRAHEVLVPETKEISITGDFRVSVGNVSNRYPSGRDRVVMPGPALEVASSASGGMSGGPVFDQHGFLIGIVSTSFGADDHIGPSYVSLLWPALVVPIDAEWPHGIHVPSTPLCEFGRFCVLEGRHALKRLSETRSVYTVWEDKT